MTSFSAYPNAFDGYGNLRIVRDGIDEIRARDHNSLRDAILNIQQELGIQPSGAFGTVRDRLDIVGDASATIDAHLIDITAHAASSITIADTGDSFVSTDVEGALEELGAVLPARPDVIGEDNAAVPNSGIFDVSDGTGKLHVFNTGAAGNILKKTQPINVTGVHIIDVGSNNGVGEGVLGFTTGPDSLTWRGPGDSTTPAATDVSSAVAGTPITLTSVSGKSIRVVVTTASLPGAPTSDTFDIFKLDAKSGNYSLTGDGIKDSSFITRTATTSTGTSRLQFVVTGKVYPADKGTLVLQRKLRLDSDQFSPIALLDLGSIFDENNRTDGQDVYVPDLDDFDTITLFDVHPTRKDYETLNSDADGNPVHSNFDITNTYNPFQIGKYIIPVSNDDVLVTGGELEVPSDISEAEIKGKVSAYRIVHYVPDVTNFNGEPAAADIFSISDAFGGVNDGDNTVRISNVIVDNSATRPGFGSSVVSDGVEITPVSALESDTKTLSGIHYYNSSSDLFDVEVESDTDLFNSTYLKSGILTFNTDAFSFPTGVSAGAFGQTVDVLELEDLGGTLFSDSNLPDHTTVGKDAGFYFITAAKNTARRLSVDGYQFSTRASITATFNDPFGAGTSKDAYGYSSGSIDRILVNSFNSIAVNSNPRATSTTEYFTDEDFRVGSLEDFEQVVPADNFTGGPLDTFDSSLDLVAGELQIGGLWDAYAESLPGLIFPQDDYTTANINPTQFVIADYSSGGFEVESFYQRLFNIGFTTNGGRLRIVSSGLNPLSFDDIEASNSLRPFKILVKIPGAPASTNKTGWLDIGKLFEPAEFDDDDGALSGTVTGDPGDFTVPFTFGTKNTADTNNMIAVRVVGAPGGSNVADAKTRIISYMELLTP